VAATGEQAELAERFRQFVTGLPGLVMAAREQARDELVERLFTQDRGRQREPGREAGPEI
jgi:hypothetical protein